VGTALRARRVDLEAVEQAVRAAVLVAGARVVEALLQEVGTGRQGERVRCRCGQGMQSKGLRRTRVLCLLGWVRFERSLYVCPRCGQTRYPGDEELDIVNTSRSPGVRRQVARLGAKEPFAQVAQDMAELAGVRVSRKDAERVSETVGAQMEQWQEAERRRVRFTEPPPPEAPRPIQTLYVEFDGTGVPMVKQEVQGRQGKQEDGSAKTREAKLGCVFTQTTLDEKGRPMRDPASTTFVGAIEPAAAFGWRIYAEAVRRGVFQARRLIVLGDGAEWVKNLAALHFGQGQFIIDFYHACEHVGALCDALFSRDLKQRNRQRDSWLDALERGEIEALIDQARQRLPKDPKAGKDARTQIAYFDKNKEYMRYAAFRQQGLFIGSGVIEAGCKTVIGQRFKQSGMEWTVRGANAILALRCTLLSGRAEEFWEQRAA